MKRTSFLCIIFILLFIIENLVPEVIVNERPGILISMLNHSTSSEFNNEELILQYLKNIQDNFSADGWVVPAMEDNSGERSNRFFFTGRYFR